MQFWRDRERQLTKEDLILILLVGGTVLLALWLGSRIL